jgi:hypothetical protein
MDHHEYMAWWQGLFNTTQFCKANDESNSFVDDVNYEVWIGEWSLATDVCA